MKKIKRKRRGAFSASLFYFPFFALALASGLAFFGLLLAAVLTALCALALAFVLRAFLGESSPWKARGRSEDCATLLFLGAVLLGSYLIFVL